MRSGEAFLMLDAGFIYRCKIYLLKFSIEGIPGKAEFYLLAKLGLF